jgi:hypothetical protein
MHPLTTQPDLPAMHLFYMTISDGYREKWRTKFSSAENLVGKDYNYGVPKNWRITTDLPTVTVFFSKTRTLGV